MRNWTGVPNNPLGECTVYQCDETLALQYQISVYYIYEKVSRSRTQKRFEAIATHDWSITYNWRLCRWLDHFTVCGFAMSLRDKSDITSESYCHLHTSRASCVWETWNERWEAEDSLLDLKDFSEDVSCVLNYISYKVLALQLSLTDTYNGNRLISYIPPQWLPTFSVALVIVCSPFLSKSYKSSKPWTKALCFKVSTRYKTVYLSTVYSNYNPMKNNDWFTAIRNNGTMLNYRQSHSFQVQK